MNQQLVRQHHNEAMGEESECRIKSIGSDRYYLWWEDGQIQHRDTYWLSESGCLLERTEKRYHDTFRYVEGQ